MAETKPLKKQQAITSTSRIGGHFNISKPRKSKQSQKIKKPPQNVKKQESTSSPRIPDGEQESISPSPTESRTKTDPGPSSDGGGEFEGTASGESGDGDDGNESDFVPPVQHQLPTSKSLRQLRRTRIQRSPSRSPQPPSPVSIRKDSEEVVLSQTPTPPATLSPSEEPPSPSPPTTPAKRSRIATSKKKPFPQRKAKSLDPNLPRPNPKVYGHIEGSNVLRHFESRMDASQAGVHGPPVAGIAGSSKEGAYSIALSGGYEDDLDKGDQFTYTGAGGRALGGTPENPKNLRTAPQSFDQVMTFLPNAALNKSVETGKPIRVLRGFKARDSPYAPETGYRYDGLYICKRAWIEAGKSGYQVCRFAFERLPNQRSLPIHPSRRELAIKNSTKEIKVLKIEDDDWARDGIKNEMMMTGIIKDEDDLGVGAENGEGGGDGPIIAGDDVKIKLEDAVDEEKFPLDKFIVSGSDLKSEDEVNA